jgi:hypothetical protein
VPHRLPSGCDGIAISLMADEQDSRAFVRCAHGLMKVFQIVLTNYRSDISGLVSTLHNSRVAFSDVSFPLIGADGWHPPPVVPLRFATSGIWEVCDQLLVTAATEFRFMPRQREGSWLYSTWGRSASRSCRASSIVATDVHEARAAGQ